MGNIKIISLDSPHNRNALSKKLLSELSTELKALKEAGDGSHGGTRALILASELDTVFCAGADLKERKAMSDDETQEFLNNLRQTCDTLENLPIPTIAAINNTCVGGGFELALATTMRISSPLAKLAFPETRLGIIPGAGGIRRLRRLVGPSTAASLVLNSRWISARYAASKHLVDILLSDTKVRSAPNGQESETGVDFKRSRHETLELAITNARYICKGAPVAIGAALRLLQAKDDDGTLEKQEYDRCLTVGRRDRDEALQAFQEKRPPIYEGA